MTTHMTHVIDVNSGEVRDIPTWQFKHRIFNPGIYVEATADAKPYVQELYKPKTVEQFEEIHPEKVVRRGRKNQSEEAVDTASEETSQIDEEN